MCPKSTHQQTIKTEEGTIVSHSTPVDNFPQKVIAVSNAESRQFATWAANASAFLTAYKKPKSENELKQYDEAFKAWQDATIKHHSEQDVVNLLGAYLGQRMVHDLDMEWVMVTDQYGQDCAVRHKKLEVLSFPFSTVKKRIEDKEYEFIYGVFHVLKYGIENGEFKERHNSEPPASADAR